MEHNDANEQHGPQRSSCGYYSADMRHVPVEGQVEHPLATLCVSRAVKCVKTVLWMFGHGLDYVVLFV